VLILLVKDAACAIASLPPLAEKEPSLEQIYGIEPDRLRGHFYRWNMRVTGPGLAPHLCRLHPHHSPGGAGRKNSLF